MADRGGLPSLTNAGAATSTAGSSISAVPPHSGTPFDSLPNSKRHTFSAGLGYLAIVTALFHRLLLGDVLSPSANLWGVVPFSSELRKDLTPYLNGIEGDVWQQFEPWHYYQYRAAREGRFPLWNPHNFCGFPLHANGQSAMLSPFHWIYFVIDPKWAAGPVAMLKMWVAGFATYWLARQSGLSALGSFVAGLSWMLSAFMVRWLQWNHSAAAALLPVVLVSFEALIERPSLRRFAFAGLAATALQLSGHPESQFHVGVLSGLFVLLRVWGLPLGTAAKSGRILLCLSAHILGLLGAASALLPLAEQILESADWHEATHALRRTLPRDSFVGALAPDHFGRPRAGRFYQGPLNYNEAGLYFGVVPLMLAMAGILKFLLRPRSGQNEGTRPVVVIFAVWFSLCGAIVFGCPGALPLLDQLPLFSKSDNLRLVMGLQFAGAILAGEALTQIVGRPSRLLAGLVTILSCAAAAGVLVLIFLPGNPGQYSHVEGIMKIWSDSTVPSPREHRSVRTLVSLIMTVLTAIWSAGCFGWVWRLTRSVPNRSPQTPHHENLNGGQHSGSASKDLSRQSKFPGQVPRWVWVGSLVLTVVDLCWVTYDFNPVVPARIVFPNPPAVLRNVQEMVGDHRLLATDGILLPNLGMVYGWRDLRGYDFPLDRRWAILFRRLGWKSSMNLLPRDQVVSCVRPMVQSVADKCCVRFLYTSLEPKAGAVPESLAVCDSDGVPGHQFPPWKMVARGVGTATDLVYQNPTPYPRAYFATRVTYASAESALDAVLNASHDLRSESFVEQPLLVQVSENDSTPSVATIELDEPEEVVIRTQSTCEKLLVLSDRYDPNWRVEINGSTGQGIRANYLFRGVVVPAGEHLIRWSYEPTSFRWGCLISTVTLTTLILIVCLRNAGVLVQRISGRGAGFALPARGTRT